MNADSDAWRELKQFENVSPSEWAFRALAGLLETWPGNDQGEAFAFAEKLLARWPDETRVAPWSWCKAASKGIVPTPWRLARSLALGSRHLTKKEIDLVRLADRAPLDHITELDIRGYSDFQQLSLLYHRPELFPALKRLAARDQIKNGDVRALAESPLWKSLEAFSVEPLGDSLVHKDASRIVPRLPAENCLRQVSLHARDLMAWLKSGPLPHLESVGVFVRSIDDAAELARRPELSQVKSLSIAFRCGFNGSAPWEPFLGNVIEADEAAAEAFFSAAKLDRLEKLEIIGHGAGYWGREGLGRLGLETLIASGLLQRIKHLGLTLLPLGDVGVAALAPALGAQLESLELVDVYCKSEGAKALAGSPALASLQTLNLSGNRIDANGFAALAAAEMPRLRSLDVSGPNVNPYYWHVGQQPLTDDGGITLMQSRIAGQLRTLKMANCFLGDAALKGVFGSKRLSHLDELDLSHNAFSADAVAAIANSPLWKTLREVGFSDCRLDNAAIESLARVADAPALRILRLAYNIIGPRGARALANWPSLAGVWHLDLHDNVLGDEGLIALADSPFVGRLLELDLEQDCWNTRKFEYGDAAAKRLAASASLKRLGAIFSGCVDEYHGAGLSPGFNLDSLALLAGSSLRPSARACCLDFSRISEYLEMPAFDEHRPLDDHDFRKHTPMLNEKEATVEVRHTLQQVRLPRAPEEDNLAPAKIGPCPTVEDEGVDWTEIEGLSDVDPTPSPDFNLTVTLSHECEIRPMPTQVGKYLGDTLDSILRTTRKGYFETGGATTRRADNGASIPMATHFYFGIKGEREPAMQWAREALWWIGAPEETASDDRSLDLTLAPESAPARFAQLATLKKISWKFDGQPGYRLDRVPFTDKQRAAIRGMLSSCQVGEPSAGWTHYATHDDGRFRVYTKHIPKGEINTLNVLFDHLTPDVCAVVHSMLSEAGMLLLPMAFATTIEAAETLDCPWPQPTLIRSPAELHWHLSNGPYAWWKARARS